jgi:hypothetical protein
MKCIVLIILLVCYHIKKDKKFLEKILLLRIFYNKCLKCADINNKKEKNCYRKFYNFNLKKNRLFTSFNYQNYQIFPKYKYIQNYDPNIDCYPIYYLLFEKKPCPDIILHKFDMNNYINSFLFPIHFQDKKTKIMFTIKNRILTYPVLYLIRFGHEYEYLDKTYNFKKYKYFETCEKYLGIKSIYYF